MSDNRKSWKAKPSTGLTSSTGRKDIEKRKSRVGKASSRETLSVTPEQDRKSKAWRKKGDELSFGTIVQQRNIEQFLLGFEMKRLRGTNWKYFDITTSDEADAAAASKKNPLAESDEDQKSGAAASSSPAAAA